MIFEITSICKGGGYMYCRTNPKHPKANNKGLYPLHRVRAEIKLGRLLEENEIVHHIDGDKTNDNPENLQIMTNQSHSSHHHPKIAKVNHTCAVCGDSFALAPAASRLRLKRSKFNMIFCSRSCGGKHWHLAKKKWRGNNGLDNYEVVGSNPAPADGWSVAKLV